MKNPISIAFLIFSILLLSSIQSMATGWRQYTYDNSQYVSLNNIKEFYKFNSISKNRSGTIIKNAAIKLEFKVNSPECLINNIKFILSKPITAYRDVQLISTTDLDKVIDPILRPINGHGQNLFKTVIIDAGHGGKDPGAVNSLGTEAGYNLIVAKKVEKLLLKNGFNVIMVRSDNTFLSLSQRVELANKYKSAIFISIHFNAEPSKTARGIETFTLSPQGVAHYGRGVKNSDHQIQVGNHQDSQNIALGTAVHGSIVSRIYNQTERYDRGIRRARYTLLTGIKHPSILIEGGFLSNKTEAKIIHSDKYQQTLAIGIAEGVKKYHFAMTRAYRKQ